KTELSTFNGKYQDLLQEKEQLELRNASLRVLEDREADVNQLFSYLEALLVMGVHESVQDEAGTSINPVSGETSFD
ncbi:hypothetical protein Tco_0607430, partial [Tanacetum coccineum]